MAKNTIKLIESMRSLIKSKWAFGGHEPPEATIRWGPLACCTCLEKYYLHSMNGESPKPSISFFRQQGRSSRQMASLLMLTDDC